MQCPDARMVWRLDVKVRRGMMMQRCRGRVRGSISGNKITEKETEKIQMCVIHGQCEAGPGHYVEHTQNP